jgi:hypothetical protein
MSRKIMFSVFFSVMSLLLLPVLFGNTGAVCPLASAQDNPCLQQDATLSALKLENLELRTTIDAQDRAVALLKLTGEARSNYPPQIITVPVIITATPDVTATQKAPDSLLLPADVTLAPTAANSQIMIVSLENPGDLSGEGVRIRNTGNTVNATGWQLMDLEGNVYTFGELLIFSNTEITIYTRAGRSTPIALFWGLERPVWQAGDVVTLTDARGQILATEYVSDLPESP